MTYRMNWRIAHCALFICCLSGFAGARTLQSDLPTFINPAHRPILQRFLRSKPYLRVATFTDVANKALLEYTNEKYGENKSPYYAIGDFNSDGREDFAVAFVDTRRPKDFVVAVFNGPFGGRKLVAPAYYDETKFGTDSFLLPLVDGRKHELQIGIGSDTRTVILKTRKRRYYIWEGATQ